MRRAFFNPLDSNLLFVTNPPCTKTKIERLTHGKDFDCIFQQQHTFFVSAIPIAFQINQTPSVVIAIFPCWGAVGGDDTFAALEGFSDDETEVLGECRKYENIAPLIRLFFLLFRNNTSEINIEIAPLGNLTTHLQFPFIFPDDHQFRLSRQRLHQVTNSLEHIQPTNV